MSLILSWIAQHMTLKDLVFYNLFLLDQIILQTFQLKIKNLSSFFPTTAQLSFANCPLSCGMLLKSDVTPWWRHDSTLWIFLSCVCLCVFVFVCLCDCVVVAECEGFSNVTSHFLYLSTVLFIYFIFFVYCNRFWCFFSL